MRLVRAIVLALAAHLLAPGLKAAVSVVPIQFAGQKSELVISEVSDRMARIELLPIGDSARPNTTNRSTILVSFPTTERFRGRELSEEKEIRAGKLRIHVKAAPLTVSISQANGKAVQELVFAENTNTVKFHTDAPVLGLGEGANQFDRRGALYPMLNGQRAPFLATHGGTIPVPFL